MNWQTKLEKVRMLHELQKEERHAIAQGQYWLAEDARVARKEAKDTQGKRLRKAGAKANKFDAEAAGKKKNNKNGLLH